MEAKTCNYLAYYWAFSTYDFPLTECSTLLLYLSHLVDLTFIFSIWSNCQFFAEYWSNVYHQSIKYPFKLLVVSLNFYQKFYTHNKTNIYLFVKKKIIKKLWALKIFYLFFFRILQRCMKNISSIKYLQSM